MARELGRKYVGIKQNEEYMRLAGERLKNAKKCII